MIQMIVENFELKSMIKLNVIDKQSNLILPIVRVL